MNPTGAGLPSRRSEFMTWIGRDCDLVCLFFIGISPAWIRIYDLNWKGLWRSWLNLNRCRMNHQNLWPELEGIVTVDGEVNFNICWHQNLWPELEGIVTISTFRGLSYGTYIRIYDLNWKGLWPVASSAILYAWAEFNQNLWPELEGIVTSRRRLLRPWFLRDQNLWPELEGIVTYCPCLRASFNMSIRIYDLNWKGLWLFGRLPPEPLRAWSEFMTWIGRDCDDRTVAGQQPLCFDQNLWPELEGIVTSSHVLYCCGPSQYRTLSRLTWYSGWSIRIYDLNWKGLWPLRWADACFSSLSIRIYDLNWKGLWLFLMAPPWSFLFVDQNLWPELEGIVTNDLLAGKGQLDIYQNLWPELEGIVTSRIIQKGFRPRHQNLWPELEGIVTHSPRPGPGRGSQSEFMTWIGRDCDTFSPSRPRTGLSIRIYDLNWKGLWHILPVPAQDGALTIRIYDLNWKGLWPFRLGHLGADINGFIRIYDLNWKGLWPIMSGLAEDCERGSEFMTWIGRDCDLTAT